MKINNFTHLDVWQEAHEFVLSIYKASKDFPKEEQYRLKDQLCRSAASIPANIAEGTGKNTLKDYINFLYNARGSLEETKYHLILAKDLSYLEKESFKEFLSKINKIGKMLNGLINSLEKSID